MVGQQSFNEPDRKFISDLSYVKGGSISESYKCINVIKKGLLGIS